MPSLMDVLSGMVTKKGRFGTDPYDIFLNHRTSRMPSLMDVLSGMVTKKGRFGTDPYDIFFKPEYLGCRTPRLLFRAWLQRRVGLEPTPTIFFSTTGC